VIKLFGSSPLKHATAICTQSFRYFIWSWIS